MKYIAFYDLVEYSHEKRSVAPSAANVVEYMADVISDTYEVEIISPSRTLNQKGFFKKRVHKLQKKISLIQPPSFGVKTPLGRFFSILQINLWLLIYLLRNCKKNEKIIVYHSLSTMNVVNIARKIKKLKVILEIREIYADVLNFDSKKELKYFKIADSYIFPTKLLNDKINIDNKPFLIATGIYKSEEITENKFNDNLTHIIYAGTLKPNKGSSEAIKACAFLSNNYHLHILGYGTSTDIERIKKDILDLPQNSALVSYHGLLRGKEFNSFLQKCHIGLVTQDLDNKYNDTSFPSKTLTYLSNNLNVLSVRLHAIESSPVGSELYYYDSQSPKNIANAIMQIKTNNVGDKTAILNRLDKELRENMKNLIINN